MTAYWVTGGVLDVLAKIPDGSIDLVLSSPPFFALRSYLDPDDPNKADEIGSEPTPGEFIDTLLDVTEECLRVLAPHGTLAFELGDTYAGSGGAGGDYTSLGMRADQPKFRQERRHNDTEFPLDKSLCLIPELYRMSLAYGFNPLTGRECTRWRVRNVVRWVRPNPPVGALGDKFRPATSEMVVACQSRARYFDLDAVRTPSATDDSRAIEGPQQYEPGGQPARQTFRTANAAGAPPLDWWEIPTAPYLTPSGLLVVPVEGSAHRVRVPVGAPADDIQRTVSPDCPVHGSLDRSGPTPPDDGRGVDESNHSAHSDDHLVSGLPRGSAPTQTTIEPLAESLPSSSSDEPAAKRRSKPSSKTAPAPATIPAGTPSARTTPSIADTSTSPESSGLRPDTLESSSDVAYPPAAELGSADRIDRSEDPSSACTCSWWVEIDVASESTSDYATWPDDMWQIPTHGYAGSHYATWPPALCEKPIKAMSPLKVCTTCGEPSRRIVDVEYEPHGQRVDEAKGVRGGAGATGEHAQHMEHGRATKTVDTIGWTDCGHDTWRSGRILDPFAGSGTTLAVATGHGRDAIGIDLDHRNFDLARERVGMFLEETDIDGLAERLEKA